MKLSHLGIQSSVLSLALAAGVAIAPGCGGATVKVLETVDSGGGTDGPNVGQPCLGQPPACPSTNCKGGTSFCADGKWACDYPACSSSPEGGQPSHVDAGHEGSTGIDTGPGAPVHFGKVDILFDIDNSASMGDKQDLLVQSLPQLVSRLVTPRCVDATGAPTGVTADISGNCSTGTPEFAPVTDMHIGVVTSSLGSRLGCAQFAPGTNTCAVYVCDPATTIKSTGGYIVSNYNDDQGHLINRTGPNGAGSPLAEAGPSNFLNWFPPIAANDGKMASAGASAITTTGTPGEPDTVNGDFIELAGAVGQSGCGIESQVESWYRFLIQPDPYASLTVDPQNGATWVGVDSTIIQQRHDFLRPDSLVAVVVLTDENDSEIDVRSFSGTGYQFMSQAWPPPPGTSACQKLATGPNTGPTDPACKSCGFLSPAQQAADPSCNGPNKAGYTAANDWGANLNLRHVHMLEKYGLDAQFPLTRYTNGLTSKSVPNRNGEYPVVGSYVGNNNCGNPLFASALPTAADATTGNIGSALCNLPAGTRGPGDVFYAHIGGVPHQLLQSTPGDGTCPAGTAAADCPQKDTLASSDWVKILGQGPASYTTAGGVMNYDYTGIDPHMVESYLPRTQLSPAPTTNPALSTLSGPAFGTGANPITPDPINGREWVTNSGNHSLPVDRQYACIFELQPASQRDCATLGSVSNNTLEYNSCDCTGLGDTPDQVPPLCANTSSDGSITSSGNDYTVQVYGKAYPTIRELTIASMLGPQGVVGSMCPIHTQDNGTADDPLFGYRPTMDTLVNRMKGALAAQK